MLAERIAEYVTSLEFSKLPGDVVKEVKRRVIDSIAVMFGAYGAEPTNIALKVAKSYATPSGAMLFGSKTRVAPDWAAFTNSVLVRYLDFNDTYLSKEALHPSDLIPAVLAAGEVSKASGKDVITGIVAGYEIACRLADAANIRDRGYDHVTYIALAAAAGVSKVLGLDSRKVREAINIAGVAGVALRQTRAGELSMWKGCAAANAARHGTFAALLAAEGLTGPSPIFEGEMGIWRVVSGEFTIEKFGGEGSEPYKVLETSIKNWPVEYHSMSAVECALKLRKEITRVEDVEGINIKTFSVAHKIIVKDPEKWRPKTRETADHSLPYITCRALLDGDIWLESYKTEKLNDTRLHDLLARTKVEVEPKYDELYPKAVPNEVSIKLSSGRVVREEVIYPKGHYANPLNDEELDSKFFRLSERLLKRERAEEVLRIIKSLERLDSISELMSSLASES